VADGYLFFFGLSGVVFTKVTVTVLTILPAELTVALAMSLPNFASSARPGATVHVFYTSASLTAGKTAQAITLPAGGATPATGRIGAIHIFALAAAPECPWPTAGVSRREASQRGCPGKTPILTT
jgi:hypothetical protein